VSVHQLNRMATIHATDVPVDGIATRKAARREADAFVPVLAMATETGATFMIVKNKAVAYLATERRMQ
jgi:hypothetical protein